MFFVFCSVLASLLGAQTFKVLLMQQNVALLDVHGSNQVITRSKMGEVIATMVYDFIILDTYYLSVDFQL